MSPQPERGLGARLVTNTLHAASGRMAAMLLWLVVTPFVLRDLGPAGYAIWALFYALTGYLSAFDLGLSQIVLRFAAAARGGREDSAGAYATLSILGYVMLTALWLALMIVLDDHLLVWLRIPIEWQGAARFAMRAGPVVFLLSGVANVGMSLAQALGRFDLSNRALLTLSLVQGIGMAIALARGGGLHGLILATAAGWGACAVLIHVLLRVHRLDFRWGSLADASRVFASAMRFGGPMQITNALAGFNIQMDKILLARIISLSAVAPYDLASRVSMTVSTIPQLLLAAVLPESAALHAAGDTRRSQALYERGSRYYLSATVAMLAPLATSAPRVLAAWLGAPQPEVAVATRWVVLAVGSSLMTGMGTTIARSVGRTDLEMWFALVAVGVHLVLSLLLVPTLGVTGACIAIAAGNTLGALVFMFLFARAVRWDLRHVFAPLSIPLIATAAALVIGLWVDWALGTPPEAQMGGWGGAVLVASASFLSALAVLLASRYLRYAEALDLLRPPSGPSRRPS